MYKIILALLSTLLLCISCEKSLFNAGKTVSEEFPITQEVDILEVQNMFEITLIQDTINKAIVTCGENLMPDIHISFSENILYLNHSASYNWSREYEKIKIDLHLKSIPWINIREPALITTKDTFKTENFKVVIWGQFAEINACINANNLLIIMSLDDFGKYVIKGKCTNVEIYPCGSGFVDCGNLISKKCKIWHRSIADAYVNVSEELQVEFKEKGVIYYAGNPDTIINLNQPIPGRLVKWISK